MPSSFPTIIVPGRKLTSAECLAKAEETKADIERCYAGETRDHLVKEYIGWLRLAKERA